MAPMPSRSLPAVLLMLLAGAAAAQPTEVRPPLKGVTAVRVANYGSPSNLVRERDEVRALVDEINQLRKKRWLKADSKLTCYSTIVFLNGDKQLALFRIGPGRVVERTLEKQPQSYSLAVEEEEVLKHLEHLSRAQPAKNCS